MSTGELKPSKLGTKEYWDKVYGEELTNFEEIGDEGEIWYVFHRFGEETVEKMVEWSLENVPPTSQPTVLEIGSGNGTLLLGLLEAGYNPSLLCGIDYSADAVRLARNVAKTHEGESVTFNQCDFLIEDPIGLPYMNPGKHSNIWDLLLDKGTYDAIALGEKDDTGRSPAWKYPARAARLLKPGGYFLITSCNFTEEELKSSFVTPESGFVYHSRIQHPVYTFGGKSGSVVSSVAFRKT
ncbi:S-adenosyl-L-methionine-dependent methyltransferase [Cyathus striatus]|nr:S-adenosyl-L-methionine-dependent methyltransferase [Cyathus striatus]